METFRVVTGQQRKKDTLISNNKRNKAAYSVPNNNYWSPLTSLVEEFEQIHDNDDDEVVNQVEEEVVNHLLERELSKSVFII